MQIEKALINDCLLVLKVTWKFWVPTIYNFAVIYLWSFLFSEKVVYFLTISDVFSVNNKTLKLINIKTRTVTNAKISVFVICVKAIIYLLLYNLHGSTFKLYYFYCILDFQENTSFCDPLAMANLCITQHIWLGITRSTQQACVNGRLYYYCYFSHF